MTGIRRAVLGLFILSFLGCAGRVLQFEKAEEILKNQEYEEKVQVKQVDPPPAPKIEELPEAAPVKSKKVAKAVAKPAPKAENKKVKTDGPRQPDIEDSEGFIGRRPVVDPFRPGEKMTFDLSYFNIVAGVLEVSTKPHVEVNGEKAYHFEVTAVSNSFFNRIYAVDDKAVTYMSYDEMRPLNLSITIKESKQLAETRTFFDWKTLKGNYWQKKVTKEKGEQSKKLEWAILPYSQNVISAVYYLRTFKLEVGKKIAFRVADEGKNIVFKAEVLRKEKLSTPVGTFDTLVLKPEIHVDGAFKPVGEMFIWVTDDDRKFLVKLESKIKIGTVVAKLKSIDKGRE